MTETPLRPWEIEIIVRLDGIFRNGNLVLGPAPFKGMMKRMIARDKEK